MSLDQFDRPDWDSFFIAMAFVISQRSIDPSTKIGCVVVDEEHAVLSTGYNGFPRGCQDTHIPLTRPEKYPYIEHAESNAIINAARNGINLKNSTFYITGQACQNCFRQIMGVGAKRIIFGGVGAACIDENTSKIINTLNANNKIEIIRFVDNETVKTILARTSEYHSVRSK